MMRNHDSHVPSDEELMGAVIEALGLNPHARTKEVRKFLLSRHTQWRGIPERRVRRFVRRHRPDEDDFSTTSGMDTVISQATTVSSRGVSSLSSIRRRARGAVKKAGKVLSFRRGHHHHPESRNGGDAHDDDKKDVEPTHRDESPPPSLRKHDVDSTRKPETPQTVESTRDATSTAAVLPPAMTAHDERDAILAFPDITSKSSSDHAAEESTEPKTTNAATKVLLPATYKDTLALPGVDSSEARSVAVDLAEPALEEADVLEESIYFDDNDGKKKGGKVCEPCEGCTIL